MILSELDEINEVTFFIKGLCNVGFEFNRVQEFVLRIDNAMIGGYYLISNKRSKFVYRTHTLCQGYFMRREKWKNILDDDDHKVLASMFKRQLKNHYRLNISTKVQPIKTARLKKWKKRADYSAHLMVVKNEEGSPNESASS